MAASMPSWLVAPMFWKTAGVEPGTCRIWLSKLI
jgi:hypothetical protein